MGVKRTTLIKIRDLLRRDAQLWQVVPTSTCSVNRPSAGESFELDARTAFSDGKGISARAALHPRGEQ